MKLLTTNLLDISIEEMQGHSYIKEVWSGVLSGKRFRELILQSLELYAERVPGLKKDNTKFLLFADTSDIDMISEKEIEWLNTEINTKYEELGFTHQAVVMPKSFFAQQPIQNYEGVSESGKFTTNLFPDNLSALRWFFRTQ